MKNIVLNEKNLEKKLKIQNKDGKVQLNKIKCILPVAIRRLAGEFLT